MLTLEQEGKLEVNRQYQEAIKVVINLVTASLVLPIAFLKNILGLPEGKIGSNLSPVAYVAWVLLGISLLACVGFYLCSTKFTKAVYGLYSEIEKQREQKQGKNKSMEAQIENLRDAMGFAAALFAVGGLACLVSFLVNAL